MTLAHARRLAAEGRAAGYKATVPTGYAPDRYFVQIYTQLGARRFETEEEWRTFHMAWVERHRQLADAANRRMGLA